MFKSHRVKKLKIKTKGDSFQKMSTVALQKCQTITFDFPIASVKFSLKDSA